MSPKSTKPKGTMREWRVTLAALALVCAGLALPQSAAAQQDFLTFRQQIRPSPPKGPSHVHRRSGDARMRVKSDGVDYDYINHQFAAVGNVQIYYQGSTVEADKVTYDQRTKRLFAEGNARLTEPNGRVTYGNTMDLSDDYRDGFVDSLRVDSPDNTRICAALSRQCLASFKPWSAMTRAPLLPNRREHSVSQSPTPRFCWCVLCR